MRKEIRTAIEESVCRDQITHIKITAEDIYDILDGVDYENTTEENDGSHDVWGTDSDGNTWRLNITVEKEA